MKSEDWPELLSVPSVKAPDKFNRCCSVKAFEFFNEVRLIEVSKAGSHFSQILFQIGTNAMKGLLVANDSSI